MLVWNLIISTAIPAVLLTLAAGLLARSREIDLSLDYQCFLAAILQAWLFAYMPPLIAIGVSMGILAALQCLRLMFNRATGANTLVSSIAAGMVYLGLAYLAIWLQQGSQTPAYAAPVSREIMALACGVLVAAVWIADRASAHAQRTTFSLSPHFGGRPPWRLSAITSVVPAAVLTGAAGALLGAHAEFVTQDFSSGLGVLGATAAMVSYARVDRSILVGVGLGVLFIGAEFLFRSADGGIQSHVLPAASLLLVAFIALALARP